MGNQNCRHAYERRDDQRSDGDDQRIHDRLVEARIGGDVPDVVQGISVGKNCSGPVHRNAVEEYGDDGQELQENQQPDPEPVAESAFTHPAAGA